jgi:D-alanyl-D-alanine carboxypeptidase
MKSGKPKLSFRPLAFFLATSLGLSAPIQTIAQVSEKNQTVQNQVETTQINKNLDTYFKALAKHNKFIGSVGVYRNGDRIYHHASTLDPSGKQITQSKHPLQYRVGSITKIFTSVMIMQLIEQGKISLDTRLSQYFPQINNATAITIEHMLTHNSGIASFTDDPNFLTIFLKPQSSETLIKMIAGYDSLFKPGSQSKYSNSNFYLLGHIIEAITGQSYAESLKQNIARPLGLKNTYYGAIIGTNKHEVSSYHFIKNQWQKAEESHMSVPHGAGAIVSTTTDLNLFMQALFDHKLLKPSSLEIMLKDNNGAAKGIFKNESDGLIGYGHGGLIDGFNSLTEYFPKQKISLAILSNGLNTNIPDIRQNLLKAAQGQTFKIPSFIDIKLEPNNIEQMVGQYTSQTHSLGIRITEFDGKLFAQADGQGAFPLTALSQTKFEFKQANISMVFDITKSQFVITQGPRSDIFTRSAAEQTEAIKPEVLQSYVGLYQNPDFPLDITIQLDDNVLTAQATGQGAFPLTAKSSTEFEFVAAGIVINFDATKNQLIITQAGRNTTMTKQEK